MDIINSSKNLVVAQDNRISQTLRAEKQSLTLTTYQKRLLLLLISHIGKDDEDFRIEEISFSDYMSAMGISKGGAQEHQIKESVLDLCNKNFLVDTSPTITEVFSWLDLNETKIDWENKKVITKLGKKLKDYYIGLSEKFTAFQLGFTVGFRSKYSYRLYEYLHSYLGQGKITISKEKAFEVLCDNKYNNITDFDRFVTKRAIEEINEHSDIRVEYKKVKKGAKTTHFTFIIKQKSQKEINKLRESWSETMPKFYEEASLELPGPNDETTEENAYECEVI